MKITRLTIFAAFLALGSLPSFANTNPYLNARLSSQEMASQTQVLAGLQSEMTAKFTEIESLIASGDSRRALGLAKSVLDSVKVKTGIDPKNKIREKFLVPLKFPANARSMQDLNEDQRITVIRTISEFRGGLYLDILNLSKRTTLLYIKALQAELSRSGGLTNTDKRKIVNDLVEASLIRMQVEDKAKGVITVFDEDVANEDHTYLFDRELKMFLLQNNELRITEEVFESEKQLIRNLYVTPVERRSTTLDRGLLCMQQAGSINYSNDENNARVKCFNIHYLKTKDMNECLQLARLISYSNDQNSATKKCFNRFN